jgi:hypothetical protein
MDLRALFAVCWLAPHRGADQYSDGDADREPHAHIPCQHTGHRAESRSQRDA